MLRGLSAAFACCVPGNGTRSYKGEVIIATRAMKFYTEIAKAKNAPALGVKVPGRSTGYPALGNRAGARE